MILKELNSKEREIKMLKQNVILHIGRHKTGTSTLQWELYKNKEILLQNGFEYPSIYMRSPAHHILGEMLSGRNLREKSKAQKEEIIKECRNKILSTISQNHITIFSSESFQNVKPQILKEVFSEQDFNVKIVCYVREPISYMISSYVQKIHAHPVYISFSDFRNSFQANYFEFFNKWSKNFNNLSISLFERNEMVEGDIVKDFFSKQLNLHNKITPTNIDYNPSLTRRYLAFKLKYNNKIKNKELREAIPHHKLYRILGELSKNDDLGKLRPSQDDANFITQKFGKSNELFFKTYLPGKSFKQPTLVSENKQFYKMSDEEFNIILSKILYHKI